MLRTIVSIALSIACGAAVLTTTTLAQPADGSAPNGEQGGSTAERVAAIKASLGKSQASLRSYEWIETTVISLKGEEKSRTVHRCYYGADGVVQKVEVSAPPPEESSRGLRGRIKEKKKEELADYMKRAVALVKSYVPPAADRIQAVKEAGKVALQLVEPNKRVNAVFSNYHMPGDSLVVSLDIAANQLLGLQVSTYLDESVSPGDKPKDPVTLKVTESALPDGTWYPQRIELDAPSKHLKVTVENSGYRRSSAQPS
jgi:hypothetical protein